MMKQAPLTGIRVVESGQVLAAPLAGMILADLGATVTKIERPVSGDPSRQFGPPFVDGDAYYYHSLNRNKNSRTLDLHEQRDRGSLYSLIAKSDVFIHNHVTTSAARLGIDEKSIRAANPNIIYIEISGYGANDSRDGLQSLDMLVQAESGAMAMTGWPDRPPVKSAVPIADVVAGLYAVITALAALHSRLATGEAAQCAVSLLNSTIASLPFHWGALLAGGPEPSRMGNGHPTIVPYNTYLARGGRYVALAVVNERQWRDCCLALNIPALTQNAEFATNAGRVARRQEIDARFGEAIADMNADDVVSALRASNVPASLVRSPAEVISPAGGRAAFVQLFASNDTGDGQADSTLTELLVPGPPYTINGVQPSGHMRGPRLGERTVHPGTVEATSDQRHGGDS